jgi:Zn-dependent peptidase ImmA (M78 family)
MTSHAELAKQALRRALITRKKVGVAPTSPLCPFDLAEKLSVEVRFVDIPSIEGMYVKRTPPLILVAADRPAGRQVFTCAHELGHHEFGHGTRADTLDLLSSSSRRSDPDEYLANTFAGFLLMPKTAVLRGFSSRGWTPARATPEQVYVVASWLGVSYEALVTHLCHSLQTLSDLQKEKLLRTTPQRIRQTLTGQKLTTPLHIVDLVWSDRPVDLRTGDFVLAPHNIDDPPPPLEAVADLPTGRLLRAKVPGIGSLETADGSWHVYVRVMRAKFAGRSIFRHLEDPDYGCSGQDN